MKSKTSIMHLNKPTCHKEAGDNVFVKIKREIYEICI